MDIDIGFWLSIVVVLGLMIWLADLKLNISAARREKLAGPDMPTPPSTQPRAVTEVVEFSNSILPVVAIVLVVRSFLFEPFTIPSGSMLPTLQVHDFILVNKFAYGVRSPERGEVMVFRYPEDPSKNYIKRIIGLPGDRVTIRASELYVNGEKVTRTLQSRTSGRDARGNPYMESVYVESLYGREYLIRHQNPINPHTGQLLTRAPEGDWQIPQDSYFVIGDNREDSLDSRFWGVVPESHVAGKAVVIWMHWKSLLSLPDFSRNGAIDKVEATQ
jgi:signal peptidase I